MKTRFASFAIALIFAACNSSGSGSESAGSLASVDDLSAHGHYSQALLAAETFHQAHPSDAEGERQFRRAKAAVMLEQARLLCFADKDIEALDLVREAKLVEPGEPVIIDWEHKMLAKLAMIHTRNADEFFASTNLEGAREEYEKALGFQPDATNAKAGLSQVLLQLNYRLGKGQTYYREGVNLLGDYWLQQAGARFSYTLKHQPNHTKAKDNKLIVNVQLAAGRSTLAAGMEADGMWAGARNEYRIALLVDPNSEEAKAGYDRTRIEADVGDKLREIDRMIRAKKFDEALAAIDVGMALTQHQGDKLEGCKAAIEEAQLDAGYQIAITLETDQDFEGALAAYNVLLAKRDYYKDTLARRDTLKGYIDKAAGLYNQALESTDPAVKLGFLNRIATFWPRYKNIQELIQQIKPAAKPVK